MNLSTLANLLKVDTSTLRRWLATYAEFFSPQANPGKGKTRTLTDHDVRLLVYLSGLRDSGHGQEYIFNRLSAMRSDGWQGLPEISQEWASIDAETMPVELAAARASELAQVAALQTELSHTRHDLQEALARAEQLAQDMEALRASAAATEAEKTALQLELERARADVRALQAQLIGFNLAYGLGRDKPIPVGVIIVGAALVTAVLISLAVVLGALLG